MDIPVGSLVAIVGSTGEGKTSLISAMLRELTPVAGTDTSVTIRGTVAYVPQVSWIFNATVSYIYVFIHYLSNRQLFLNFACARQVRENILFGYPFQPSQYEKAIEVTSLQHDLDLLPVSEHVIAMGCVSFPDL